MARIPSTISAPLPSRLPASKPAADPRALDRGAATVSTNSRIDTPSRDLLSSSSETGLLGYKAPLLRTALTISRPLSLLAKASLEMNLVRHPAGTFLSAGQHQFRSLWTRDFCWSVGGLLAIGRADVVRDHLALLFANVRESDGLLPRAIDSVNPKQRVVTASLGYAFGLTRPQPAPGKKLRPEYAEQNGHPVIDGNVLAILATLTYADATGDHTFLADHIDALRKILSFYTARLDDDLIIQPPFADWQDSTKRAGKTFYTNLLWSVALTRLADRRLLGISRDRAERTRAKVEATFFDPAAGLYRSLERGPHISLDGNLLAIDLGFNASPHLYETLKAHPLWRQAGGLPGTVTIPDYAKSDRNWTMNIAGLGHYHDRIAWSWLMAMSAKVAAKMDDPTQATTILEALEALVQRDRTVAEIYEPERTMKPWERWLYRSERPFSWGAAATIEALDVVARACEAAPRSCHPRASQ